MKEVMYMVPWWGTALIFAYVIYRAIATPLDQEYRLSALYTPRLVVTEGLMLLLVGFVLPNVSFQTFPPLDVFGKTLTGIEVSCSYVVLGIVIATITWICRRLFGKETPDYVEQEESDNR